MSNFPITSDTDKSIERASKILAGVKNGAFKAVYWSMKRAGESTKTQAGRYASAQYYINKSKFMDNTRMKTKSQYSQGSGYVNITYAGYVLSILDFHTRFSKHGGITSVQVMRGGSKGKIDKAFVANIWGHTGAYERTTPKRFPLEEKYGPSTAHMMQNPYVIEEMDKNIHEVFERRIDHEITRILNGWGG